MNDPIKWLDKTG